MRPADLEKITAAVHTGVEVAVAQNFTAAVREQLASANGVRLRGARWAGFRLTNGPATAPGQLFTAEPGRWMGFAVREVSGTTDAVLSFYDNDNPNDPDRLMFDVTLAAKESVRDFYGPHGVGLSAGLYVAVTGSITGSVFFLTGA